MDAFHKALEARCHFANSKIAADQDEAENEALRAYEHAYDLGRAAFHTGERASPLISGESQLLEVWEDGKADAELEAGLDAVFENAVPPKAPMTPDDALSALRDAQRAYGEHVTVAEVYDTDETVSEALNVVFPDFEYPDHSWKTLEAITRQATARVSPSSAPVKRKTSSLSM